MKPYLVASSSAGGHLYELAQLLPLIRRHRTIIITEKSKALIGESNLRFCVPYDAGGSLLRTLLFTLIGFLKATWITIRYRPRLHLSVGSHASIGPTIAFWMLRVPTIHVESFTRVTNISRSGRVIRRFARHFFVQWPNLAAADSRLEYEGSLF